jgi:hypothetical protein
MIQKSGIKALAIKQAASKSNKKDRRLNRSIRKLLSKEMIAIFQLFSLSV